MTHTGLCPGHWALQASSGEVDGAWLTGKIGVESSVGVGGRTEKVRDTPRGQGGAGAGGQVSASPQLPPT